MAEKEKVILYTAPNCATSDRAQAELLAEGVDLEVRNVMLNKEWWDEALRISIFVPIVIRAGKVEIGWKGAVG